MPTVNIDWGSVASGVFQFLSYMGLATFAENVILSRALGVTRLDIAFNTHPHRDHINGFAELLSKIPADEYLSTFPLDSDKYQRQLIHQLRELSIPIRVCERAKC